LVVVGLAALLALVAAACGSGDDGSGAASGAARPQSQESEGLAEATGDLPTTELEMADGRSVTFADLRDGRPLVVNYFASWCPPCRAEMPDFAAVHTDVGERVSFVGIALQDTQDDAAELVETTGVRYPWGQDPTGETLATLGGFAMPTTFYVSADGEIVGQDNGAIDKDALRDRLADLFGVTA
jgi:thiol-disulfide isomerase/thioredoxin